MSDTGAALKSPGILVRQSPTGFVLTSERTSRMSCLLRGRPQLLAKMILPNLLGLCPVAHAEAFEAACSGAPSPAASSRVASEAMLEAVRVFALQWRRFADCANVDAETLRTLGTLRQQLFVAVTSGSHDLAERVCDETKRFVRAFLYEHSKLFSALCDAAGRFDRLVSVDSRDCLPPTELLAQSVMDDLLEALLSDRDFAVRPKWRGGRILGSLARECDRGHVGPTFSMRDIVRVRWKELQEWSSESSSVPALFVPQVRLREDGWRVAAVETVRGTLMHAVKPQGRAIDDFHMIAPTEWVFQPGGAIVERLNELSGASGLQGKRLRDALEFLIVLFDPCTDVTIELEESYA